VHEDEKKTPSPLLENLYESSSISRRISLSACETKPLVSQAAGMRGSSTEYREPSYRSVFLRALTFAHAHAPNLLSERDSKVRRRNLLLWQVEYFHLPDMQEGNLCGAPEQTEAFPRRGVAITINRDCDLVPSRARASEISWRNYGQVFSFLYCCCAINSNEVSSPRPPSPSRISLSF